MNDSPSSARDHRVDFVIGGVQKGGTTALDETLRRHPDIAMAREKEPHMFDDEQAFGSGVPDFTSYHDQWGEGLGRRRCGEATPIYCWWPPAAQRIRDYNPAMKWVLLLREPASRAYSHWNMERKRGRETLGFREAVAAEDARMRSASMHESRAFSYLSRGYYARQLARLWGLFPRAQTLILRSERFHADPASTVDQVFRFLGVPPMALSALPPMNAGDYDSPLDPADRAALVAAYAPDIRELERMTGWDLADWLR